MSGELFSPEFRKLLGEILRAAPRRNQVQESAARRRRRRRSESGTFSGHRPYTDGDDLRGLDWNVYARTDELHMKLLEDEDPIGLTVLLDCSASMQAEDRMPGALRLAAILAGLAMHRAGSALLCLARRPPQVLQGLAQLGRLFDSLGKVDVETTRPQEDAERLLAEAGGGRVVWISDFARPADYGSGLRLLRQHGCRVTGWLPELEADRIPPRSGLLRFVDPETGAEETLQVDKQLRSAMVEELGRLRRSQDGVFRDHGAQLRRFALPAAGDLRLSAWTAQGAVYRD